MAIIDLVDRNGVLVGRDGMNIETEETILDTYVMRIQDGEGAIHVYPVPFETPVGMPHEIPPADVLEEIYDIDAII